MEALHSPDKQGERMRNVKAVLWAVYSFPMKGSPDGMRAVCEQGEWEALSRSKPGFYTLIQADIANEGEAERLARGTSGAARVRNSKARMSAWPGEAAAAPAGAEATAAAG
jgi:hypothetical protein